MSLHHFRPARAVLLAAMISGADVIGAPVNGITAAAPSHHQARPVYAEAIRAGTKQLIEAGEIPNAIILVSEGGEIVWEWHAWDHLIQDFDSKRENYGDVTAHPERIDINADHRSTPPLSTPRIRSTSDRVHGWR